MDSLDNATIEAVTKVHNLVLGSGNPLISALLITVIVVFIKGKGLSFLKKKVSADTSTESGVPSAEDLASVKEIADLKAENLYLKQRVSEYKENYDALRLSLDKEIESAAIYRNPAEINEQSILQMREENKVLDKRASVESKINDKLKKTLGTVNEELSVS